MNWTDVMVLVAILVMAIFAIWKIKKNGMCSSACRDCPNRESCNRRKDSEE